MNTTISIYGKALCVAAAALTLSPLTAPAQEHFQWAKYIASAGTTIHSGFEAAVALDSQTNAYVTGWFNGTSYFGGANAVTSQTPDGIDVFLAKYDSAGALQWVEDLNGSDGTTNQGYGVGVDANNNVYVTGGLNDTFFLAQYDSTGAQNRFAESSEGFGIYGTGLAVDGAGNSYALAFANNGTDYTFDSIDLQTPTNNSSESTFLVKYDNTLTAQWGRVFAGTGGEVYATKVAVDAAGNVYARGTIEGDMSIMSNTTILSNLTVSPSGAKKNMFLAKFDNAGNLQWVAHPTGGNTDEGGVAIDAAGNVYTSGWFTSTLNFGNNVSLPLSGSATNAFLAKYNSNGVIQWAKPAGAAGSVSFYFDVALDAQANVYAAGVLKNFATVSKYDSAGAIQWTVSSTGSSASPASSAVTKCALDAAGDCYVTGLYFAKNTFGATALQTSNTENIFLAELSTAPVLAPPGITKQPAASLRVNQGGMANLSVTATNATAYHWFFDGAPLSDVGNVSGSGTDELTLNPVFSSNAGSYDVVVSNAYGSVTSSIAKLTVPLEKTKPSVVILKPATGARSNSLTFSGTASDSVRVAGVSFVISNLNDPTYVLSGQATLSAGKGSSNWTCLPQNFLAPGTNILVVTASNYSGLTATASRPFFYRDLVPLSLVASPASFGTISGKASVTGDTPPTNYANLYVGEGYTVTAKPAPNTWFTNWTTNGTVASTNLTFSFIMEYGLNVQANFNTNLFIGMAGRYDGIFSVPGGQNVAEGETVAVVEDIAETNSGLIGHVLLGTNGLYTGTLYLAGSSYSLHGVFNKSGLATETIARAKSSGGNVTLNMAVQWDQGSPRTISGSVTGTNWSADNLLLYAAQTSPQTNNYTMLFEPIGTANSPPGYGYALITNRNGTLTLGAALADGTTFSQSTALGEDNRFPLYANLYNKGGLLLGRVSPSDASGSLVFWIKPATKSGPYTNAFGFVTFVQSSTWTMADATNFLIAGPTLTMSGPGLTSNLVATIKTNELLVSGEATNLEGFYYNPANGMLTISFTNNVGKVVKAYGAELQNISSGAGYFLGTTNGGIFTLTPPLP